MSLLARLLGEPRRFTLDAAVRILAAARPASMRSADPIRFRTPVGVAFPGAEVTGVAVSEAGLPRLQQTVIGLTGPAGVLPRHVSELVVGAERSRDASFGAFLELLSQRLVGAFVQVARKYRVHLAARGSGDEGPVADALLALTGNGLPGLVARMPAGASPLLHYAGLFAMRPRSADRLASLVSDWLARPVVVRELVGAWLAVAEPDRTRLGVSPAPGRYDRLSADAAIGIRAWDPQASIRLVIGPLDLASFEALLPHRVRLRRLVGLVRAYLGLETAFSVNLVVDRSSVPELALIEPGTGTGALLGWNCWLPVDASPVARGHAADAVFEADLVEALSPAAGGFGALAA